tara:strand:- start:2 stop:448 length:447 start_codon:yes stop_codon:yes gene_type:complete
MARTPKMYGLQGDKEFRKMISVLDSKFDDLKEFHQDLADIVMARALTRVPHRSGKLKETIRASGTKTAGRVRAGFKRVPYAGPVHFGWATRPNLSQGWRGGPIMPNPFLYEALDDRRDEVIQAYFDKVDELAQMSFSERRAYDNRRRR